MKPEIEFYLLKFYRRRFGFGWYLSFCEIINFDTGFSWSLCSLEHGKDGWKLTAGESTQ